MRKRNWCEYNKQLVQRGSITFLLNPKLLKSLKKKSKQSTKGRPITFCDGLIQLLLIVKIHFRLSYRALEGFARDVFDFRIPTYSLVCKRAKNLCLPKLSDRRPNTIILDASGLKVSGEGEWKVKIHGKSKRRKWIKLHLAVDLKSQEIVAELTTVSAVADFSVTEELLEEVHGRTKLVIADGAYDRSEAREAIRRKGAKALIPPPKNARYYETEEERDKSILEIKGLGGNKQAKSLWGKLTGYSRRALVETAFSRYKRLFGERYFSKTFERQRVESRIKCLLLNQMRSIAS